MESMERKKNSSYMRRGTTLVELVTVVTLVGIFTLIVSPVVFQFRNIYARLKGESLGKERRRILGAIGYYLDSASVTRIEILDIGEKYISNSSMGELEKLIGKNSRGDALYVEIRAPYEVKGEIVMKNQVHIFRFYPPEGIQNLRYIPTELGKVGVVGGKLILGKDEILIQDITGGSFTREGESIVINYRGKGREVRGEWTLRRGIW